MLFKCLGIRVLVYYPPLGDLLAVCGHLEQDLYAGPDGNIVDRSAREVGVHLDSRIIVQHDYRKVERLIFLKQSDGAVVYHAIVVILPRPLMAFHSSFSSEPHWLQTNPGGC